MDISYRIIDDQIAILKPEGELNSESADSAKKEIGELLQRNIKFFIIDFNLVTIFTSGALCIFQELYNTLKIQNDTLLFCCLKNNPAIVMNLPALENKIPIASDTEKALTYIRSLLAH